MGTDDRSRPSHGDRSEGRDGPDGRARTDGQNRPGGRNRRPDRQAVFADLAAELQQLRGGAHARDAAAAIFRHAAGGRALVALLDGGERAAFYDANARTLTAAPVDEHGLDHAEAEALWTRLSDPATWVDARAGDLPWVHPRYRWVLDGDRSAWRCRQPR